MDKRLGQHILINHSAVLKIVAALDLKKGEQVIEIGPGTGVLTKELLKTEANVLAIEKDEAMAKRLNNELGIGNYGNAEIINGDALKILSSLIHNSSFMIHDYKLVGNIPYYITGKLLRILSELTHKPILIVLTIQREVAERIVAQPPRMNLLGAITQAWAEVKIVGHLKPGDFIPEPKVDSSIIVLKPYTNPNLSTSQVDRLMKYFEFVKILFKQPRKTIVNNLTSKSAEVHYEKELVLKVLENLGIDQKERAQNLTVEKIKLLLKLVNKS